MSSVTAKVMSTVSAPYGVLLTAGQLAEKIADINSADSYDCSVFAFLSEVSPKLQQSFIDEMGVRTAVRKSEPLRGCRRLIDVSYAAMASVSSAA